MTPTLSEAEAVIVTRDPRVIMSPSKGLVMLTEGSIVSTEAGTGVGEGVGEDVGVGLGVGTGVAVAGVAGVLLVYRQTHFPAPLLPVDLLRIPIFALSIGLSALAINSLT